MNVASRRRVSVAELSRPAAFRSLEPLEARRLLSWGTVDSYQQVPGVDAEIIEMTADPFGNVYAVGGADDGTGIWHGIVREKLRGSSNWTTILDQVPSNSGYLGFSDVAANSAGDLYVSGWDGTSIFKVWKRPVGASSFTVIDNVPANTGFDQPLTIDSAGNVFAIASLPFTVTTPGRGNRPPTTTTVYRPVVRKQTGGIGPFTTMPYQFASEVTAMCSIGSGPSAGLYAVGGFAEWLVWKSVDSGNTWSQVDNFEFDASSWSDARGVSGDLDGNVYVTGAASKKVITGGTAKKPIYTTVQYMTVRKSDDGGTTWTVDDSYTLGSTGRGFDVGIDPVGNVYATGEVSGHSIVRQKLRGSSTWSTVDDSLPNIAGPFSCFAADIDGNVYAGSTASDPSGDGLWTVRSAPVAALFSSVSIAQEPSSSDLSSSDDSSLIDDLLATPA